MTFLRRFVALFVLFIATISFMVGGLLRTVDSLAGSSQHISDTAVSILSTTGGSSIVADALVTQLTKDADPAVKAVMTAKKAQLVEAVAATIRNPETLQIASDDFLRYYDAVKTNTSITINPQPIIWRLTSAMHAVDARIPANPHDVGDPITFEQKEKATMLPNESAGSASWVLLLVGLAITLLAAFFLIRNPTRKLIAVGLTLGLPGALLMATGPEVQSFIKKSMTSQDDSARRLVDLIMGRVNSALTGTGLTLLIAAALVVGGWFAVRYYRAQQSEGTPVVSTNSETPEPPVASATGDPGVQSSLN